MRIFDLFYDRTKKWKKAYIGELHLDLANRSLNNIKLGSNVDELQLFGKPSNKKPHWNRVFEYYENGLSVLAQKTDICMFSLILNKYDILPNFQTTDVMVYNSPHQPIKVTAQTKSKDLIEGLNLKVNRTFGYEDGGNTVTIESENYDIEIESLPDGSVQGINISIY